MSVAMSASPILTEDEFPKRRFDVVTGASRRRRPRLLYGIVALVGAILIGAAQMTLSILTTQTSYELATLSQQQRDLTYQQQILYDEVAGLSSPQYLAANASALGMVINESPSYLRLSDGAILGTQQPSVDASSVDALSRGSVPNSLISDLPLITDPAATIEGPPAVVVDDPAAVSQIPPALTDGLPTPKTQ